MVWRTAVFSRVPVFNVCQTGYVSSSSRRQADRCDEVVTEERGSRYKGDPSSPHGVTRLARVSCDARPRVGDNIRHRYARPNAASR